MLPSRSLLRHSASVLRDEPTGGWRALLADETRRAKLAIRAAVVGLSSSGASRRSSRWHPDVVGIAVFAVYVLVLAVVIVMAMINVKEQRARRER